jgi:hypothetical protein
VSGGEWNAYDEGYLDAHLWAKALARGAGLPVEVAAIELEGDEVAHARFAPVSLAVYSGEQRQFPPTFVVVGGPLTLAASGSVAIGRQAAMRADAERAARPHWHRVAAAQVVVTNRRVLVLANGRSGALPIPELGPVLLVTAVGGGPAVQLQPAGWPALQLESPAAPVLYVFVHHLVDGRPPPVPMPAGILERAQAQGRLP